MVSEKKIFKFTHYKSMGANDPGAWKFRPQGHGWQDLYRRALITATYKIY